MADEAAKARAEAIEGFASVLRELRDSIGTPSFRDMSGRSRAISHTTLHEAAHGNRLPSWATTVEFVKACGADPAEYRERWEQANRAVQDAAAAGPAPSPDVAAEGEVDAEPPIAHRPPARRRLRYAAQGVAAVGVVAVVAVAVALATDSDGDGRSGTGSPTTAQLSAADCPVHQRNPATAAPEHQGDASEFIADITLPDCSHVRHGRKVTKVWRFKNVGTVPWAGYALHRVDLPQQRDQCQTISDVPIPDTEPGSVVDIRTDVTAPKKPGFCFVRFKMVDASGHFAFPGSRPVNFQVIVD